MKETAGKVRKSNLNRDPNSSCLPIGEAMSGRFEHKDTKNVSPSHNETNSRLPTLRYLTTNERTRRAVELWVKALCVLIIPFE